MSEEVRTTSATGGQKGTKPERFSLLPTDALAKIARHYAVGAEKYDDHNWRKGYEWSKSYDALQRHLNAWWGGEDIDEETGSSHLAAAGFHILTLLTFIDEHPDYDNRYNAKPKLASGGWADGTIVGTVHGGHASPAQIIGSGITLSSKTLRYLENMARPSVVVDRPQA